jgi:hypothetical protein
MGDNQICTAAQQGGKAGAGWDDLVQVGVCDSL